MNRVTSLRVCGAWIASVAVLASAGCSDSVPDAMQGGTGGGTSGTGAAAAVGSGGTGGRAGTGGATTTSSGAGGSGSGGMGAGGSGTGGASAVDSGTPHADGGVSDGAVDPGGGPTFPSVTDLGDDGPFTSMLVQNSGPDGNYSIYRPSELAPGGAKNPIVGWMSGGNGHPSGYALLPHLASHGFVIVASNTSPSIGEEVALGEEIIAGIDWILMENAKSGSPFFEKLDATKIASMGYSMGALATTTIADDPRLTTTIHISGGNMETARIKKLHAPAAFLCGAAGVDIAGDGCVTDFDAATVPVFYGVFNDGDHLGVQTPPYSERISLVVTGWLRWQLMRDASLKPMFVGDQCTVCKDSNWTVKQKGLL